MRTPPTEQPQRIRGSPPSTIAAWFTSAGKPSRRFAVFWSRPVACPRPTSDLVWRDRFASPGPAGSESRGTKRPAVRRRPGTALGAHAPRASHPMTAARGIGVGPSPLACRGAESRMDTVCTRRAARIQLISWTAPALVEKSIRSRLAGVVAKMFLDPCASERWLTVCASHLDDRQGPCDDRSRAAAMADALPRLFLPRSPPRQALESDVGSRAGSACRPPCRGG